MITCQQNNRMEINDSFYLCIFLELPEQLIIKSKNFQKYIITHNPEKMHQSGQSKILKLKPPTQKSQYSESTQLHRGQKYISSKSDPQFAVAFSIPQQDVLQLFSQIASSLNFELIEKQQTYATAIKRTSRPSIFQLLNCLSWWGHTRQVNAVKLTILNNPKSLQSSYKLCRVKALSESSSEVLVFIENFKDKMEKIKGVVPSKYLFQASSSYEEPIYKNNTNPFHLQACAFYIFHQILTSSIQQQLKIRENLQKSLKQFFQAFKNLQQSSLSLPTPLNNLIGIVRQTCEQISKLLKSKYSNSIEKQDVIMPYMKISVEKYIFDRVQVALKTMYLCRDRQIIDIFNRKKQKIVSTMTKQQLFDQVLLNKIFKAIQTKQADSSHKGGIQFCQLACPELEKITQTSSPRQKIKHCQLMYAQLKSYFFQKLKMKYQLNSMEDIIPVFIIIVLYTDVQYLRSELNLMIDYIHGTDEDFEAEKRMLVNLSESYNFVVRDWNIEV